MAAFAATTVAVYGLTGKRGFFLLYGESLDTQAGNVGSAEVAPTPTFSFSLVPTKLVQLFVDPCYQALCSLADYAGGARPLPPDLLPDGVETAGNERLWRLPLAIQLPTLVLLPLCIVAVAGIVVWAVRNREAARERLRAIRLLAELTIASTGIVVGYAASTLTGSPHLRYGFARDFLLPALLTGIAGVGLVSAGLWLLLSSRKRARGLSPEFVFVVLAVVGLRVCRRLPRLRARERHSADREQAARGGHLHGDVSRRHLPRRDRGEDDVRRPDLASPGVDPDVRLRQRRAAIQPSTPAPPSARGPRRRDVQRARGSSPRWPTVMGLPPGSYELAAVKVRNA